MNKKKLGLLCTALTAFSFSGSVFAVTSATCSSYLAMSVDSIKQAYAGNAAAAKAIAPTIDACVNSSTDVCNKMGSGVKNCSSGLFMRDFLINYYANYSHQKVPPVGPSGGGDQAMGPASTQVQQPVSHSKPTPPPFTFGSAKPSTQSKKSNSNSIHWF